MRGDFLCYCDPEWVGRLAKGMRWFVRGINCTVGSIILLLACSIVFLLLLPAAIGSSSTLPSYAFLIGAAIATALLGFGWIIGLTGHWWLTAPDPTRPDEAHDITSRHTGRWGLIVAAALTILAVSTSDFSRITSTILSLSAEAALTIGCAGLLTYIARLSVRMQDANLGQKTQSARRALVGMLLLHLGLTTVMRVAAIVLPGVLPAPRAATRPGTGTMAAISLVSCLNLVVAVALLGSFCQTLGLLIKYRKGLQQAREQAQQNWTTPDVPA